MEDFFDNAFLPIAIVVGLPILFTWIIAYAVNARDKRRSDIIMETIRVNPSIDPEAVSKLLNQSGRTARNAKSLRSLRLLRACIFSFIGLALLAMTFAINGPERDGEMFGLVFFGGLSLAVGLAYTVVFIATRPKLPAGDEEAEVIESETKLLD